MHIKRMISKLILQPLAVSNESSYLSFQKSCFKIHHIIERQEKRQYEGRESTEFLSGVFGIYGVHYGFNRPICSNG